MPPKGLTKKAKLEWKRICDVLKDSNLLTGAEVAILSMYCELYAEFRVDPKEFTGAKYTQLRLCLVELGLTPKARSQITVDKPDEGEGFR